MLLPVVSVPLPRPPEKDELKAPPPRFIPKMAAGLGGEGRMQESGPPWGPGLICLTLAMPSPIGPSRSSWLACSTHRG